MPKVRVYELAKELSMENKVLVDLIRELGIEVKSHSSSLTDENVSLFVSHILILLKFFEMKIIIFKHSIGMHLFIYNAYIY